MWVEHVSQAPVQVGTASDEMGEEETCATSRPGLSRERMCLSKGSSFLSLDAEDDETVGTPVAENGKSP